VVRFVESDRVDDDDRLIAVLGLVAVCAELYRDRQPLGLRGEAKSATPASASRTRVTSSRSMHLILVEHLVGARGGLALGSTLSDRPVAAGSVDSERRPAVAVLVAEVDEQRVPVVLDPHPMARVAMLVQPSDH
jgi:hypothetical protein